MEAADECSPYRRGAGWYWSCFEKSKWCFCCYKNYPCQYRMRNRNYGSLSTRCSVQWIRELGIQRVQIEGDSLNVIPQMNSLKENGSFMATLVAEAKEILEAYGKCSVLWTKRENDRLAILAKSACHQDSVMVDFSYPP